MDASGITSVLHRYRGGGDFRHFTATWGDVLNSSFTPLRVSLSGKRRNASTMPDTLTSRVPLAADGLWTEPAPGPGRSVSGQRREPLSGRLMRSRSEWPLATRMPFSSVWGRMMWSARP